MLDFSFVSDPQAWLSLLTLTLMEIVLGIDNIVFITILCGRLPGEWEHKARRIGIGIALISRLGLLFALSWVMQLTNDLFSIMGQGFSGRDLILLGGGIFLVGKATHEIYENVEEAGQEEEEIREDAQEISIRDVRGALFKILAQVLVLDVVFSLDSVITAVGMADNLAIMGSAMLIAVGVMLIFAGPVGDFVQNNPSVKILALAFLVLIGVMLVVEGMGGHVSKGYIYSAIGFSLFVEMVNLQRNKKSGRKKKKKAGPKVV